MRHEIELRVQVQQPNDSVPQWYPLDIGSGNTLTLDYVSNLLSDVSKIDSGRSFTVKLPRTRRNDTAFDLAVVPQHESITPYRYLPCRVYVDGIDVAGEAYMYLVSADSATYNAVIVFGLMREYKAWIDAGKTLKELSDGGQTIRWGSDAAYGRWVGLPPVLEPALWYGTDANINTYTPANGLGKLMYYGIYNPGFDRDDVNVNYANVHPFVTVRELWERIVSENGLQFTLPTPVLLDMEDLAIVLTKISGNDPAGTQQVDNSTGNNTHPRTVIRNSANEDFSWAWNMAVKGDCYATAYDYGNGFGYGKDVIKYKGDSNNISVFVNMQIADTTSFPYQGSNHPVSYILNAVGHLEYFDLCIKPLQSDTIYRVTPTLLNGKLTYNGTIPIPCENPVVGDIIAEIWIDNNRSMLSYLNMNFQTWTQIRSVWDNAFTFDICTLSVIYYEGTHNYPHPAFRFVSNLPDIKQLDFVKMVCHLYGLFPCQRGGTVYFIPIDELEDNKPRAYDWSRYLLEDDPDAPHHTDWHMTDLARRNRASYKEDEKDLVIDETFLDLDDDTLDPLKDFFTIPLAASDGDTIRQYEVTKVGDDQQHVTYEVEFTECLHRLMRVVQWTEKNDTNIVLSFQNLSTAQILAERYSSYRAYVNQPRILTERLRVPLADLRTLDYSKPVFLSKYGRHFAVIDIKWTVTQDTCEAKLLMLGSQIGDVSPAPPPPVLLTGIRADFNQGGTIYDTDSLNDLKQYLTVTAEYSDSTTRELTKDEYTLSGTLTAPSSTITVSFESQTDTFTVQVTHQLPYDSKVEYLESDGSQWIDTGIVLQENDVVEIEAMFLNKSGDNFMLGASGLTGEGGTWFEVYGNTTHYVRFGSSSSASQSGNASANMNVWRTYKIEKGNFYVDGVQKLTPAFASMPSRSLVIFGRNNATPNGGIVKIRSAKILRNGLPILDLSSVRAGSVGYMYDTVLDSLLTNNGVFSYGNDI